jgi:hypothetical protein
MKTPGSRILFLFTIFAALFFLASIASATEPNNAPLAWLRLVQGDVRVSGTDGKAPDLSRGWQQAEADVPIEQGFSIATGEGRAEIEFATGGRAYLAENSVLQFRELWEEADKSVAYMSLVTGTATFWLDPVKNQSFFVETPTDQVEISAPETYYSRMDSYLDGTAITPLGEKGATVTRNGLGKLQMFRGKTLYFRGGELIPQTATSHPATASDWDSWVAAQTQQEAAATVAALKASGLSSPIPGLTDLYARGSFFSCAPYGTCWEPKEQEAAQAPSAQSPAPSAPNQVFQAQTVTWQQLDWRWGNCAGPTSTRISRVAHTPEELKELLRQQAQANSNARLHQGWDVMACRQGEWIYRHGHYAMVVKEKVHPECKGADCKRVRPPVTWVKTGKMVGFVPRHPNDVKGNPPVNLKHGIFVPHGATGQPFQRIEWNPSQ